jgi:TetR/AcrR family transcriptional regulator, regulator of cefoperazone and chloramphenicol sensitivity
VSTGRPYRSTLRAEQAAQTRLRIRRAARELFQQRGFADTTIAQIAEAAGVAVPTVYATYRSKGGVVGAILEDLEQAADQAGWEERIVAASDPARQLRLFVAWIRAFFESGAPVLRAAMDARSDPDVAAMVARGDANRLAGTTELAAHWAGSGALRPGLAAPEAARSLWLLTSAEQFLLATDVLGWSPEEYERWLAARAHEAILGPDADLAPDPVR